MPAVARMGCRERVPRGAGPDRHGSDAEVSHEKQKRQSVWPVNWPETLPQLGLLYTDGSWVRER
jgi:hypothetical protein